MLLWDGVKRTTNLAKHGLDFLDAFELFEGDFVKSPAYTKDDERRAMAIGTIAGRHVTLIYTERESAIRCISLRKANKNERKQHEALFGE